MILKKDSTKFDLSVRDSNSTMGLREGDHWCIFDISISNQNFHLDISKEILSKNELADLLQELRDFLDGNDILKKRVSFIKNYFLIYLETGRKGVKRMKVKLVHVGDKHTNYVLLFDHDEILEVMRLLGCVFE